MTDDIDGAVWDVSFMKGHFYPRAKRVGADLVRVEAEALKAEPVCVKSQKL